MTHYARLTPRGQLRRLRVLALDALRVGWSIEPRRLRRVAAHSFNTIFEVRTADGQRLALRVGSPPRIHPPETELVESHWLSALAVHPGVDAPIPIRTRDGHHSVAHSHPAVDGVRPCSLFTWVPGRPLIDNPSVPLAECAGHVLAELHDHAASITTPPQAHALAMAHAVYFGPENRIEACDETPQPALREALARCDEELAALAASYPAEPHLLHGDFGAHNVLTRYRQVRPIDFQDVRFGFDIHDLAIAIANLSGAANDLVSPFRRGYERIRPWPSAPPAVWSMLAAARSLNIINLALVAPTSGLADSKARHVDIVTRWMRSSPQE